MAAVDYARLRETLPRARLLFVAHREEILDQSLATFRHGLRDHAFGELWVGRPAAARLRARVRLDPEPHRRGHGRHRARSLRRRHRRRVPPRRRAVLPRPCSSTCSPSSCSASPRRPSAATACRSSTGSTTASPPSCACGTRSTSIASRRSPTTASTTASTCARSRGGAAAGYDVEGLSNLLTANDVWARHGAPPGRRARRRPGRECERSASASASSTRASWRGSSARRASARSRSGRTARTTSGRPRLPTSRRGGSTSSSRSTSSTRASTCPSSTRSCCCARPTARRCSCSSSVAGCGEPTGKTVCTVLDFVGQHRTRVPLRPPLPRAARRKPQGPRATRSQGGFPFLPAGCHMELDRVATDIVLGNIREAVPSRWTAKVEELRRIAHARPDDQPRALPRGDRARPRGRLRRPEDLVGSARRRGPARGASRAGGERPAPCLRPAAPRRRQGPDRGLPAVPGARRAAPPRVAVGSRPPAPADARRDRSWTRRSTKTDSLEEGCALLWEHPQVRAELTSSSTSSRHVFEHLPRPLATHPDVPLQVHARYSRIEILAAFGVGERGQGGTLADGRLLGEGARSGPARVHARQDQRPVLADDPLSRLRHQPRPDPLGEPVDDSCRQRDRPALPATPRARHQCHALRAPAQRRSGVLVPRAGRLRQPRVRAADGDHLAARPSLPGDLFAAFAAAVA